MGYDVGDPWPIVATFTNSAGALVDPTSVVITVKAPNDTQTTPVVSHPSLGVYTATVTLSQAGYWHAIIDPAGVEGIEPAWAYATPLPFTPTP